MKRSGIIPVVLIMLLGWGGNPHASHSETLPPYPLETTRVQPSAFEADRAEALFFHARRENPRLAWDACLSRRAFKRAKEMVEGGYFAHRHPRTGENPAWEMVARCGHYRYAAENLILGYEAAGISHRALMGSPTHRANIMSSRHHLVGVGCYEQVCVQLFAGR